MEKHFKERSVRNTLYHFVLFLLLLGMAGPSWASPLQTGNVTGVVTSSSDGSPLIGVSVQIKEVPGKGTVTDLDGNFSIAASRGQTLVFSYVGFISQEVKVTKSVFNIEMKEDAELLDEVVVIGYGTMKRSDLTGSVVSVTGDELKKIGCHFARPGFAGPCRRCVGYAELGCSGRWYLGQYSWYQLVER